MANLIQISLLAIFFALPAAADSLLPLSPPPVRGSAEDLADMNEILAQQSARMPRDCERASVEADQSLATFFGPPYGPLNPQEVAYLAPAFARYLGRSSPIVKAEKAAWGRLRPYLEDSRVQPCVQLESKLSYPSGHATTSELFAQILIQLFPDSRAGEFLARAHQIGDDRVLAGMHHPTDILAGRQLGREIFVQWMGDPTFVAELKSLKDGAGTR